MDRDTKNLGLIFDETVKRLEEEVNSLKTQQRNLKINIDDLSKQRDNLTNEVVVSEQKIRDTESASKAKIANEERISQEKLQKATSRDAESARKSEELDRKLSNADNLIKSNESLRKVLEGEKSELNIRIQRLNEVVKLAQGI